MNRINKLLYWSIGLTLLILLLIETKFLTDIQGNYVRYLSEVLLAILTGSIVGVALNKFILNEQQEEQLKLLNISSNVLKSGFEEYYTTFEEVDLIDMMKSSNRVDIYVTYADHTIGNLSRTIKEKLKDRDFRLEIFITDKENPFLASYAQLWEKDDPNYNLEGIRDKIDNVLATLKTVKNNLIAEQAYNDNLGVYSIRYHPVFFSFYRFDDHIVYVPTKLIETKNIKIPAFRFTNTGEESAIYHWCMKQLQFIKDQDKQALDEIDL